MTKIRTRLGTGFEIRRTKSNSSSSSKYINKTTTTNEPSNFDITGEDSQPLVYPARL